MNQCVFAPIDSLLKDCVDGERGHFIRSQLVLGSLRGSTQRGHRGDRSQTRGDAARRALQMHP